MFPWPSVLSAKPCPPLPWPPYLQGDAARSPKANRLSDGSRRSSSGSTTESALTGMDEEGEEEEEEMDDGNQRGVMLSIV